MKQMLRSRREAVTGVALVLKVLFWMAVLSWFGAWHVHRHYW